jgi:hypothetical protein
MLLDFGVKVVVCEDFVSTAEGVDGDDGGENGVREAEGDECKV